MKSIIFCLVTLCLFVLDCYARCDCDAADSSCISKCVVEANSCVTACKGNIECYESCISDKWPSAAASFKQVLASSTGTVASATALPSGSIASASATGFHSASATASKSATSTTHSGVSVGSVLKSSAAMPLFLVSLTISYFMA